MKNLLVIITLIFSLLVRDSLSSTDGNPECFLVGREAVANIFLERIEKEGEKFWENIEILGTWIIEGENLCVTFVRNKGKRKVKPLFYTADGRYFFPAEYMIDLYSRQKWGRELIRYLERLSVDEILFLKQKSLAWLGKSKKAWVIFIANPSPLSIQVLKNLLMYKDFVTVFLVTLDEDLLCLSKEQEKNTDFRQYLFEAFLQKSLNNRDKKTKTSCSKPLPTEAIKQFLQTQEISLPAIVMMDGRVFNESLSSNLIRTIITKTLAIAE